MPRAVSATEHFAELLASALRNVDRLADLAQRYADDPVYGADYAGQLRQAEIHAGLLQGRLAEITERAA